MKERSFTTLWRRKGGFTLVEVMISLAVIALAVLAIMGLTAVFLQGTKAVVERSEALSICQALNAYLQTTTGTTQGFDKVYSWLSTNPNLNGTSTSPQLYAFTLPLKADGTYQSASGSPLVQGGVAEMVVADSSNAKDLYAQYIPNRIGRLYYISLSLSQTVPIHLGVARVAKYKPTSLPSTWYPTGPTDADYFADSSLSVSVRIYAVPSALAGISASQMDQKFNYPILLYDTTVNR